MKNTVHSKEAIFEYVSALIQKKSKFPADCVVDQLNYIDTGYVDSMATIKFVLDIESKFGIEISDDDLMSPRFRTVGGLVQLIADKASAC